MKELRSPISRFIEKFEAGADSRWSTGEWKNEWHVPWKYCDRRSFLQFSLAIKHLWTRTQSQPIGGQFVPVRSRHSNLSEWVGNFHNWIFIIFLFDCLEECGNPEIPAHGRVNVSGRQANYYCDPQYNLIGDDVRNCSHGMWTGGQPICK